MPTHPSKKISWEQAALWIGIVAAIAGVTGLTLGDFVDKQVVVQYVRDNAELIGLGILVLVLAITILRKRIFFGAANRSADLAPGTPDPDLVAKVRKYLTERYEHRLRQKLAGRQPVNLRILPSITGTSKEGAENYITLQEEEVRAAIGDIFTRANGRLLLVGLPGSGKTTLVLQLAMHLLERPGSSMPVVLNLATWRAEFKTFEEWLKKILPTELGASTGLAEQIGKHTPLILLLDGLDEVPEADRDSLLAGIGEYGADANRQFLISSRIAEYATTKDAPVNAQVEVAPLTVEQVEIGLAATAGLQPESKRLLNALKSDPLLRSAVENPFYLNTAQLLFSTGKNWSELGFVAKDVAGRQRELVERFVKGALERKVSHEYPLDKAGHWLSFLASRMTERNMVVFELRDLQYGWWKWRIGQSVLPLMINFLVISFNGIPIIGLTTGLAILLIDGLKSGPIVGLFNGLVGMVISILVIGLICMLIGMLIFVVFAMMIGGLPPIITKDNIIWSWKNYFTNFRKQFQGLRLVMGLGFGVVFGLKGGLIFVLILTLIFFLIFGLISFLKDSNERETNQVASPYHRFDASNKVLWFSILQHLLLSYQLYQQGLLPFRLPPFLNELSLRHILEFDGDPTTGKGGGAWRFRHRILQEWFAEKWVEPEWPEKKTAEEKTDVTAHKSSANAE